MHNLVRRSDNVVDPNTELVGWAIFGGGLLGLVGLVKPSSFFPWKRDPDRHFGVEQVAEVQEQEHQSTRVGAYAGGTRPLRGSEGSR